MKLSANIITSPFDCEVPYSRRKSSVSAATKMEAVQFNARDKTLKLIELPIPTIVNPKQVLVKVAYAGICGTDLHIIQGEFPCRQDAPVTLGHEFSGVVIEIGSDVTEVRRGDKVAVDPNKGCQVCTFCHSGNPHFCKAGGLNSTIGIFKDGGWAEYCLVPDVQVSKLPSSISLEHAALCEPLSCLSHGWDKISPVTVGQNILIIGAGIIGNLWAVCLHLQGHRKVTVSEPNAARRNLLGKLNTGYDIITPDQLKKKQTAGIVYDLIVDCSGFAPAIENAIELLNYGGKLCIFGVSPPHAKISASPYNLYLKEASIFAIKVNPYSFPKAIGLLEALGDRYLNYENLGVKTFALKEYKEAMDLLKKGNIAKAVFKL